MNENINTHDQVRRVAIGADHGSYDAKETIKTYLELIGYKVIDVGTGGGFPLLPLAMTNPDVKFTWIDARRKKVGTINKMVTQLEIPNARAIRGRIEECESKYDYHTARAVGYTDKLLTWSYALVKSGWYICLYKQVSSEEKKVLQDICKKKALIIEQEHIYKLPGDDIERVIYVLKKK